MKKKLPNFILNLFIVFLLGFSIALQFFPVFEFKTTQKTVYTAEAKQIYKSLMELIGAEDTELHDVNKTESIFFSSFDIISGLGIKKDYAGHDDQSEILATIKYNKTVNQDIDGKSLINWSAIFLLTFFISNCLALILCVLSFFNFKSKRLMQTLKWLSFSLFAFIALISIGIFVSTFLVPTLDYSKNVNIMYAATISSFFEPIVLWSLVAFSCATFLSSIIFFIQIFVFKKNEKIKKSSAIINKRGEK